MPILDARGRLWGRFNLIDATVAIVIVLLIPLGYSAYLLFRVPIPTITAVERIPTLPEFGYRLRLRGENLRPYLRANVGTTVATFLVQNPQYGEVFVAPGTIAPGEYDLTLYDDARELLRVPHVLTVDPVAPPPGLPTSEVKATGWFTGLDLKAAQELKLATPEFQPIPPLMRVITQEPPEPDRVRPYNLPSLSSRVTGKFRVNALVVLRCTLIKQDFCSVDGSETYIGPGLVVPIPRAGGTLNFRVEQVYSAVSELVDVRVRFPTPPDTLALLKREVARGDWFAEKWGLTPRIMSFGQPISGAAYAGGTMTFFPVDFVQAVLRVPAERSLSGWTYQGKPLRAGDTVAFDMPKLLINGLVLGVDPSGRAAPGTSESVESR